MGREIDAPRQRGGRHQDLYLPRDEQFLHQPPVLVYQPGVVNTNAERQADAQVFVLHWGHELVQLEGRD